MRTKSRIVPVSLANGTVVQVVATVTSAEEDVSDRLFQFSELVPAVEGLSADLLRVFQTLMPHKGTVEFGFQVAIESGKLTALLVKGAAQANVKVALEWVFGDSK